MPSTNNSKFNDVKLLARIQRVTNSDSLRVCAVGPIDHAQRGIASVRGFGRLEAVVRATLGVVAVTAALAAAAAMMSSAAHAGGYDSGVYDQGRGQVMQQGSAVRMEVVSVRPVKIEVAAAAPQSNGRTQEYAVTAAGAGAGAIVGQRMGGKSASGRQIGAILGGLMGGIGANMVNETLSAPSKARQIDGMEIVLRDPGSDRLSVVTQAGGQGFVEGDRVLVTTVGGSVRVVADHSQQIERGAGIEQRAAMGQAALVTDTVRTAEKMGIRVDRSQVAEVLQRGGPENGTFSGRVVAVDRDNGLVYQSTGRGQGVVHELGSLSKEPRIGEEMTVRFRGGVGLVVDKQHGQGVQRG